MLLCEPTEKQISHPAGLKIVGVFPFEGIINRIGKPKGSFVYKGYKPNLSSDRLLLFKREFKKGNLKCCICGEKPTHFVLDLPVKGEVNQPHFNLYKIFRDENNNKKFLLFTKDHIVPRSKGGKDHLDNYQVMCQVCNSKKGDSYDEI